MFAVRVLLVQSILVLFLPWCNLASCFQQRNNSYFQKYRVSPTTQASSINNNSNNVTMDGSTVAQSEKQQQQQQQQQKQSIKKYKTLLLDMDGVLADVSNSYRTAIEKTCHVYGATSVTQETITQWKARGNANDDWKLSYDLIQNDPNGDHKITLDEVTKTFEEFYQGTETTSGLYKLETLIPKRETLVELRSRCKQAGTGVGIVTGRPRRDCIKFLNDFQLIDLVDAMYCMEDGPSKPDPYPVLKCCELLGVHPDKTVVLIGDTPDDIQAAVSAGCSGIGVTTPEAYKIQIDKNESHTLAPLSIVMKEQRGADCILEPGFEQLLSMF